MPATTTARAPVLMNALREIDIKFLFLITYRLAGRRLGSLTQARTHILVSFAELFNDFGWARTGFQHTAATKTTFG
jgi:hypothetical protein